MKNASVLLTICAALLSLPAMTQETKPVQSNLPEGPGKQWVLQYCTTCHELKRIEEDQGTEAEWITRIRRMIRRGATIPNEQIEPLGQYLAQALPPRVRSHPNESSPIATAVAEVVVRPIQMWVRSSGRMRSADSTIVAMIPADVASLVRPGQRVKAFSLRTRSSMFQGRVAKVTPAKSGATVEIEIPTRTALVNETYIVEIIAEHAPTLSIPNEAIIEEGDRRLVYVQQKESFSPREIQTGVQGELHTEVTSGLSAGEHVVTFGSFFIDAEYKLKAGSGQTMESETFFIDYRSAQAPREGENDVEVFVRQPDGKPLKDGTITLTYSMAAMPSMNMPEMREEFTLTNKKNGHYTGRIRLSMAGTWQVRITASRDGKLLDSKEQSINAK